MLMLLAIIEVFRLQLQCVVHWVVAPHQRHHRSKRIAPADRHNHRYSTQKPEWLKQEIIRLKVRMPQAGCRTISDICNRRFAASHKVTVGKTYVHQVLQNHEYEIKIQRRNIKHVKPKAQPRNHIWGIDLTGKTDTQKNLHALFGIIDHGSRALLHLQVLHDKTTQTIIDAITQTIRAHGKPEAIRTDNEGMFRSPAFADALKQLGIRHQRTSPSCPWQNGRIERLFGTLKQKLDQWIVTGIEQLNGDLNTFRHWYNHVRPHQNLEGRTPAEAWNGINPYIKPPKHEGWFEAWEGLLTGYELKF